MIRVGYFDYVTYSQFVKDFEKLFPNLDSSEASKCRRVPFRATKGSAGYDLFSPIDFTLAPGESITIPTGIKAFLEEGWVLMIFPRSGLGFKYRVQLDNTVGIIDSDYVNSDNEGHIFIKITNDSKENKTLEVKCGSAIAQGVLVPFGLTVDDDATAIRNGGLGSTDRA